MRIDDHYGMLELPQQGWAEAGLQSCKSAIDIFGSLVPILGPTLSQILDANINTLREERIKKFLQALSEYQEKIPHQILTSEEFTDAIRAGISRYLTEPSEKKRQFILNLNRSLFTTLGMGGEGSPFQLYFVFNDFFDQLSLPAIDCLVHFQDKFNLKGTRYDIIQFFNKLHGVHGKRAFMELVNNALIEEEGMHEMPPAFTVGDDHKQKKRAEDKPIGQKIYRIQPLGGLFSDWLKTNFKDTQESNPTP